MQISKCFMCNISRILKWKENNGKNHNNSFVNDFLCMVMVNTLFLKK